MHYSTPTLSHMTSHALRDVPTLVGTNHLLGGLVLVHHSHVRLIREAVLKVPHCFGGGGQMTHLDS